MLISPNINIVTFLFSETNNKHQGEKIVVATITPSSFNINSNIESQSRVTYILEHLAGYFC